MAITDTQLGPILEEDVLFLQAIIKMTTPKVLIEFGHFWGKSAKAMLEAMDSKAVLHSYDNTKDSNIGENPQFIFHRESQECVEGIKDIDFIFLDASHELELNQQTFLKVLSNLSPKAIIAVHDTGTWIGGNVFNAEQGFLRDDGQYVHCPEELEFVNWIKKEFPDWQQIHFHSSREVRHGMTLLQKYKSL